MADVQEVETNKPAEAPASEANKKPAAKKAAKKVAKKKAATKTAEPKVDNRKITVLVDNPKKPGSAAHKRFSRYKSGQTVTEALAAGVSSLDIAYDSKKRFIKVQ